MRLSILFVPALLACLSTPATAAPAAPTPSPQTFGAGITVKKPVDIARLTRDPKRYLGRTVRLEGTVKAVCQGMGCWVEVASARGGSFLAKSLDESILLPKDCAGRTIVVQGVVAALPAKAEGAREHAESDSAGHDCPQPTYVVDTRGVVLMPPPR